MKIAEPIAREMYNVDPMKHIEAIGRICYKSEEKIGEGTAHKFIKQLFDNKHGAMLEHYIFILQVPFNIYKPLAVVNYPYMECTNFDGRCVVSASARTLQDMCDLADIGEFRWQMEVSDIGYNELMVSLLAIIKHLVYFYGCDELFGNIQSPCEQKQFRVLSQDELVGDEIIRHGWHSVLFRHDRGFTHEIVRMRPASFAQESTRYCNYNNAEHIEFIMPFKYEDKPILGAIWKMAMKAAEAAYFMLVGDNKDLPQWARGVLPQSVKADIVVTTRNRHWQHILDLRYVGTTGAPHPQMKQGMELLTLGANWAAEMIGAQNL